MTVTQLASEVDVKAALGHCSPEGEWWAGAASTASCQRGQFGKGR